MLVDSIFENADVFNVFTKSWTRGDIVVHEGRILFVGDLSGVDRPIDPSVRVDCEGRPVIPGLIDIHLHIESSLCTPHVFAGAVLSRGVTSVVAEPHEIANVFGIDGIREMIRLAAGSAIDIFFAVPSSVPSTNPDLETTGGRIGVPELEALMHEPAVVCLGEVMNFGELIDDRPCDARHLIQTMRNSFPLAAVEGHVPSIKGFELAKILYEGVDSDHCLQDLEGLKQRFENGMFVELQEKSIAPEIIEYLSANNRDGLFCLVTDDVPPDVMRSRGHLDAVIRKTLSYGLPIESAVIATSLSPAARIGFRDRGAIAPGRIADFVVLKDRSGDFVIHDVYKAGRPASEVTARAEPVAVDTSFTNSVKLPESVSARHFRVPVPEHAVTISAAVSCRAMKKSAVTTYTELDRVTLPVTDGFVQWERTGVNLVVVVDRYTGSAEYAQGFLSGEEVLVGAFASTHAHDHHNLMVIGSSGTDMKLASEWVISNRGGICIANEGEVLASLALPVAGILSEEGMDQLADAFDLIQSTLHQLGIRHHNPFMTLTTISLPVSPAVKITDKGLVDVRAGQILDLFLDS